MAKQITEEKQYSGHQATQNYQTITNHPNESHFNVPSSNQMINNYGNNNNMTNMGVGFNQNNPQTNYSDGFQGGYQQYTNFSHQEQGKMEFDNDSHHDNQDKSKKAGGTGWQCH